MRAGAFDILNWKALAFALVLKGPVLFSDVAVPVSLRAGADGDGVGGAGGVRGGVGARS